MLDDEKLRRRFVRAVEITLEKYDEACQRHQMEVQVFQADVARRVREYAQRSGHAPDESALDRLRRGNRKGAGEGTRSHATPRSQPSSSPPHTTASTDHDEVSRLRDRLRATEAELLVAQERERRLQAELDLAQERQRLLQRDAEVARLREELAAARTSTPPSRPPSPTPAAATPGSARATTIPPEVIVTPPAPPAAADLGADTAPSEAIAEPTPIPAHEVIIPELILEATPEEPPPTSPSDTRDDDPNDRGPLDRARRALDRRDFDDARGHFDDAEAEARAAWTGDPDTRPAAHVLAAALRGGAEVALEFADFTASLAKSGEAVALVLDLHLAAPSALTLADLLASLRIQATALLAAGCPHDAEAALIDALQLFEQADPRHKGIDAGYEVTFLVALQDELHRPDDAPRT